MSAAWLAAWAAVATAIIYVALGAFAAVQVLQARRTRELTYRPYVVVDFEFRRFLVYVSIKNIGQTPATDVRVTFDQPLRGVGLTKDLNEASVFSAPIPMVAPGRNIRVAFGVSHQILTADGIPLRYEAQVEYRGAGTGASRYKERYVMDLSHYKNAAVDPKGLPDLVDELEAVRRELQKWTADHNGLLTYSVDRDRYLSRRDRPYWREHGHEIRQTRGWPAYLSWLAARWLERLGLR